MDLTKAPIMPPAPQGMDWAVRIEGDHLHVDLVNAYEYVLAHECREMVTGIRNYWDTQGVVMAVRMAHEILQRIETADRLSAQLGVKVRVTG